MDRSKMKNFIIVVLLLVNAFFLTVVAMDKAETLSVRREAEKKLLTILDDAGISIADGILSNLSPMVSRHLVRDMGKELSMMKSALGNDVDSSDKGGNIWFYNGSKGQAQLNGTGELEILPWAGTIPSTGDATAAAVNYLKKLGIDSDPGTAEVSSSEGISTVTLTCNWEGVPVFNCKVSFTFSNGSAIFISGFRPLDTNVSDPGNPALDVSTILMRFLDMIYKDGVVCSEIISLKQGYVLNVSVSGDGALTPYWYIVTDSGEYSVNGLTGIVDNIALSSFW
jgi:Uncharacterized protein conserved in bacteria